MKMFVANQLQKSRGKSVMTKDNDKGRTAEELEDDKERKAEELEDVCAQNMETNRGVMDSGNEGKVLSASEFDKMEGYQKKATKEHHHEHESISISSDFFCENVAKESKRKAAHSDHEDAIGKKLQQNCKKSEINESNEKGNEQWQ